MIHLRILAGSEVSSGVKYFPETVYTCPKCGRIGFFYSVSPICCSECKETLPDLCKLKSNLDIRKQYHMGN